MYGLWGFIERSNLPERDEDREVMSGKEVEEGGVKEVYEGLHSDVLKPMEEEEELKKIFNDLRPSTRVVNTWFYSDAGEAIIKQDKIPEDFHQAMLDHGLDQAIKETVEVFEDIADHGYAYCDLSPGNIRFQNGKAIAIDYLDNQAVESLEKYDMTTAAAMSYDLFTRELAGSVPGLEEEKIERKIDEYSVHVETDEYTGNPFVDFAFNF